jgi:hypothetical protein
MHLRAAQIVQQANKVVEYWELKVNGKTNTIREINQIKMLTV